MELVSLNIWIVGGHSGETFVPVGHRMDDAVGLGRRGHFLCRAGLRQFECVAHDPVAARAGKDRLLDRHFGIGAFIHPPADLRIFAFDVFAHDHHVDVFGSTPRQRRGDAGQQARRAQINVLKEFAPDRDQHSPQRDMIGHTGHPDRTEKNRIERAQLINPVFRHDMAGFRVIVAVPAEFGEFVVDTELRARRFQRPQTFGHHFLADPVTGDDRNFIGAHDFNARLCVRIRSRNSWHRR